MAAVRKAAGRETGGGTSLVYSQPPEMVGQGRVGRKGKGAREPYLTSGSNRASRHGSQPHLAQVRQPKY